MSTAAPALLFAALFVQTPPAEEPAPIEPAPIEPAPIEPAAADRPHVVFVTGDEEYRSEESMPMLAAILERDHGVRTTVLYAEDEDGGIDPMRLNHIAGLEALADADLMVLFARYRQLPPEQMRHFLEYVSAGKPVAGFRTATHTFLYPPENPLQRRFGDWNEAKIRELVGQRWIVHHGHFADGNAPLTAVKPIAGLSHPILRGVGPFEAYSWLYHVEGGGDTRAGDPTDLLTGRTLRSNKEGKFDRYPPTQPVAWTMTNPFGPAGSAGAHDAGRVFYTSLGHPYDFKDPNMRRVAVQGILWAAGLEGKIPAAGVPTDFATRYDPANSGFDEHKRGLRPETVAVPVE